jgi:predicted nucleotide-binding protein (sugar kinase/HSP70/actin superfamily)
MSHDQDNLRNGLKQVAAEFKLSDRQFKSAVECGLRAYKQYKQELHAEGERILKDVKPLEKILVIISRPYNGYDPRLSMELPEKIRDLGLKAVPLDFLPPNGDEAIPYMYWRYGRRILGAAERIRKHPNLFAVYITSFGCGPDSFIAHFFRKQMSGKPYLQLELDEHTADAGMITRCEAFIDSLRFYEFSPPVSSFSVSQDEFRATEKTIYIPNMCDHAYAIRAAMERCGLTAEVMDEPDELTVEIGKKFCSGKECFPCVTTTGDMIKKLKDPRTDLDRAVFFMPGADGPCRFGLYSQFHRIVLDDLGYKKVPIFSPNSRDGYTQFGLEKTPFRKLAWSGAVVVDCLAKMLHRIRPYELNAGETEKKYFHHISRLDQAILNDISLETMLNEAAADFKDTETSGERRPIVGVVGEIYLRNNRFSNNFLIEKLEKLGLEVWLATFCEWPMYTSLDFRRDAWLRRDFKNVVKGTLQVIFQQRQEHKLVKAVSSQFDIGHEYPTEKILDLAAAYLPRDYKGEALLSIGKSIEMAEQGAGGIVNAMPFNCMPGTVVSSLSKKVSDDNDGIPWLNMSYEGLRDSGEETRLEAFAEQVKSFSRGAAKRVKQRV